MDLIQHKSSAITLQRLCRVIFVIWVLLFQHSTQALQTLDDPVFQSVYQGSAPFSVYPLCGHPLSVYLQVHHPPVRRALEFRPSNEGYSQDLIYKVTWRELQWIAHQIFELELDFSQAQTNGKYITVSVARIDFFAREHLGQTVSNKCFSALMPSKKQISMQDLDALTLNRATTLQLADLRQFIGQNFMQPIESQLVRGSQ